MSIGPDFRCGLLDKAGREAVGGVVVMRYGENPLRVLERVKAKMAEIEPGLHIIRADGDVADMGIMMTENIYRRLANEPERPYKEVIHEASTEVGGPILTAVSNTIISFIPVSAPDEAVSE